MGRDKKRGIAVSGAWLPAPLAFLRSRACAELSPHAAKLFLDLLGMLGPNASRNGDLSLAPAIMRVRGWSGRTSLEAATKELVEAKLLIQTRQGGRKDCSLWAVTLYPLACDLNKIEVRPGCYLTTDYSGANGVQEKPPTADRPAVWRRARKNTSACPATGQTVTELSRHGTK
ncbi:hypothetical protein GCM10027292_19740 [Hydrogenophaga aquatica]